MPTDKQKFFLAEMLTLSTDMNSISASFYYIYRSESTFTLLFQIIKKKILSSLSFSLISFSKRYSLVYIPTMKDLTQHFYCHKSKPLKEHEYFQMS